MEHRKATPPWLPGYILESMHRAGFIVRVEDGRVVVDHPERETDEVLLAAIEDHHDALLAALTAGDDAIERARNATKGEPDA